MAKKYIHTEVDGIRLKLSNLDKIIYPTLSVSKAQIIQYYMAVQKPLLNFISGRPLTVIRFPDGIHKQKFYSKDMPDWAPDWVDNIRMDDTEDENTYVVANKAATVVWLANLVALELHPMLSTTNDLLIPDHWIIDLDPDESISFEEVKNVAFQLKEFLEKYDYYVLIKTSGGKGLHLVMPIIKKWTYEELMKTVKSLMRLFIKTINPLCTLHVHKNKRKGKILLDIYRNHRGNTTVAPYSLRGRKGAPFSAPVKWEDLEKIDRANYYHINNAELYFEENGFLWENWRAEERPLHDKKILVKVSDDDKAKLKPYKEKRNFKESPEPSAEIIYGNDDQFVIQLHDASNLHYDLRLELDGVLKSWAIPKALPQKKGIKRLAIETEDHPIKYLDFEGHITDGNYGAGDMWIFHRGTYQMIEKSKNKYEFILTTKLYSAHFKLFRTKSNQWLIERMNEVDKRLVDTTIDPMLATLSKKFIPSDKLSYEIKWDGIRSIIYIKNNEVKVQSRSGRDLSEKFPELTAAVDSFEVQSAVLDGEIVCLDEIGRPVFSQVISRMHSNGLNNIARLQKSKPVYCYVFDLLFLDGKDLTNLPLHIRQKWLAVILKSQGVFRLSETFEDGKALLEAARNANLEGVMVKNKMSRYSIGQRSDDWKKVKFRSEEEVYIIGFTEGKGDRVAVFGALHVALKTAKGWTYKGKVGTGFDMEYMKILHEELCTLMVKNKYIEDKIEDEKKTSWVEAKLKCQIQYASLTSTGIYREPVFQKLIN